MSLHVLVLLIVITITRHEKIGKSEIGLRNAAKGGATNPTNKNVKVS